MISQKIASMPVSATMAMTQKARDLRAKGVDVISLSVGEPDFDTPEFIKSAAKRAMDAGHTKYTAVDGIAELKQAVCDKFLRENGLKYTASQVNVSPGGKAVLYNAFAATLDPGDEVLIPAPCWVSYPDMVKMLGGKPVILETDLASEFKITPEQLETGITERCKWLLLNSPSNPTGSVYSETELQALGAVISRYPNVMVLTDEIYEHLVYEGKFVSFAEANPDLHDRTLTMNGVSKAYAMTGWRIGYAGGPEPVIRSMAKVMTQTTSNPCSISQWAAEAALNGDQSFLKERLAAFRKRRDFVVSRLSEIPELKCTSPGGAFYVFVEADKCLGKTSAGGQEIQSDVDLCMALLAEAHIAVVPGSAFKAPGHFRLSYATDMPSLETALDRLGAFIRGLR